MRTFLIVACLTAVLSQPSTTTTESVDMIPLQPFDVQIALLENRGIQQREVSKIVTEWMNDSYTMTLEEFGYTEENGYATFDSVGLLYNTARRRNLRGTEFLYTAKFKGGVIFSKQGEDVKSVPKNDVLYIQQLTLHDDAALADRLRNSEYDTLGSLVIHATAYLNSVSKKDAADEEMSGTYLEAVIIGAIVVAGVAFLFLLAAVVWAYRFESKQEAFKIKPHHRHHNTDVDKTDTDTALDETTPEKMPLPIVRINHPDDDDQQYPESVISDSLISGSVVSEDVSASLSQYYRSGMGSKPNNPYRSGMLSDAGSVSSMESYGYSVDAGVMPLPTEVSLGGGDDGMHRIGGLPIEPQNYGMMTDEESASEDVNLPDLNKELGHLNIQLLPLNDDGDNVGDETTSIDFTDDDNDADDIVSQSESHSIQQPK